MPKFKMDYDVSFWKTPRGKEILKKENPGVYKSLLSTGFFTSSTKRRRTASTYHDPTTRAEQIKRANQLLSVIAKMKAC